MPDGHRWSGYSHEELYEKINSGPGPRASHASMERWEGVSAALTEINSELHAGVLRSGATWEGSAADQARRGINPLASWADEARGGAEMMRLSAELQAEYISKARADMPPPVKVTAEDPGLVLSTLTHLVGGQTDYEVQEKAHNAAEQRAREVMTTYASSTTANTSTLGQFHQPPQLVINASDIARNDAHGVGGVPGFGYGGPRGGHGGGRRRGGRYGRGPGFSQQPQQRPAVQAGGSTTTSSAGHSSAPGSRPAPEGTTSTNRPSVGLGGVIGGAPVSSSQQDRKKLDTTVEQHLAASGSSSGSSGPSGSPMGAMGVLGSGTTSASSAEFGAFAAANAHHAVTASPGAAASGLMGAQVANNGDTVHKRTAPVAPVAQAFDPFGGLGGARGAEEEEDAVHDAADYLRETDDIYGVGGVISPPVIGESTTT
jgi:PPE family